MLPNTVKKSRADRAQKRARANNTSTGIKDASMSRTDAGNDILNSSTEEGAGVHEHIDPNVILDPERVGGGSRNEQSRLQSSERPNGRGRSRRSTSTTDSNRQLSRHSEPSRTRRGENSGTEQAGNPSEAGYRPPPPRPEGPVGDEEGDGTAQSQTSTDRTDEEKERAVMTALLLIEEVNDLVGLTGTIRLTGQSKVDAKRLLDNVKSSIASLVMLKIGSNDEILLSLKSAKRDVQRLLMQSDEFEANTAGAQGGIPQAGGDQRPGPPIDPPRSDRTTLQYQLATKQLDFEILRLTSPKLVDVSNVQPDILKDLMKVDVPDVRNSVDRARDAMKTLSLVADVSDGTKILEAQEACEKALNWITAVETRCKSEQLHLDVKMHAKKVDFAPFRPGSGVSIYEFFGKFEAWSRGRMSKDQRANILYSRHLDASVVDRNTELEAMKEDYEAMKRALIEKWGAPDLVCEQYLENITKLDIPSDPKDDADLLAYTKNAYSNLMILTKLESERGQKVPGLENCYVSNSFLRKLNQALPKDLASKFLFQIQENGESYFQMKGRVYFDRILALLRCSYKSLEIIVEEAANLNTVLETETPQQNSIHSMYVDGYTSSSSSDETDGPVVRSKHKDRKKSKAGCSHGLTVAAVATPVATPVNLLGYIGSKAEQTQQLQYQPTTTPQLGQSSLHPTRQTMSVNMFGTNMWPTPQVHQQSNPGHQCVPINHVRRISKLEASAIADAEKHATDLRDLRKNIETERKQADEAFARLQKQLSDQEERISALKNDLHALQASYKMVDAASQTDPDPVEECETLDAASVCSQDANCNTETSTSEMGNASETCQPIGLQNIKLKKKRKLRKNRSRGARARAKAAAALARSEAEAAALAKSREDPTATATETIPAHPVAATNDRRYVLVPEEEHLVGDTVPLASLLRKNLFQGFCPPVVDPYRLLRWFLVDERDKQIQHI